MKADKEAQKEIRAFMETMDVTVKASSHEDPSQTNPSNM